MKKLTLVEWAAVAEITGTVAVVVSLLFVAYSVNQNTVAVQATSDNFIYELQYARTRDIVSSPGMAAIYVKVRRSEALSAEEQERFLWDKLQELSTWEPIPGHPSISNSGHPSIAWLIPGVLY